MPSPPPSQAPQLETFPALTTGPPLVLGGPHGHPPGSRGTRSSHTGCGDQPRCKPQPSATLQSRRRNCLQGTWSREGRAEKVEENTPDPISPSTPLHASLGREERPPALAFLTV